MRGAPQLVVGPCRPGWHDLTLGANALAVRQKPEPEDDFDAYYHYKRNHFWQITYSLFLCDFPQFNGNFERLTETNAASAKSKKLIALRTNLKCQLKPLWISESRTEQKIHFSENTKIQIERNLAWILWWIQTLKCHLKPLRISENTNLAYTLHISQSC